MNLHQSSFLILYGPHHYLLMPSTSSLESERERSGSPERERKRNERERDAELWIEMMRESERERDTASERDDNHSIKMLAVKKICIPEKLAAP